METGAIIYLVIAIVNFLLLLVGGGVAYGKLVQKNNTTDSDVKALKGDVNALRVWGESEIAKQVAYRETHFVNKDVLNQCLIDITRRLDEVNTIELNSRLSRIEAQLDQIQIILSERK